MIEKAHTWDEKQKHNGKARMMNRLGIKHQAILHPEVAKGIDKTDKTRRTYRQQVNNDFITRENSEDGVHRRSNNRSVS